MSLILINKKIINCVKKQSYIMSMYSWVSGENLFRLCLQTNQSVGIFNWLAIAIPKPDLPVKS